MEAIFIYEVLTPDQYPELDRFVESHPQGCFTQSAAWRKVKDNWGFEAVAARNGEGAIVGTISVLIQKIPLIGTSFLYAPRGPVCDLHDEAVLRTLKEGVDELARRYNAHSFKMDPDLLFSDAEFTALATSMGFTQSYGPDGFEGIQARFNYRLYLENRTEDALFAALTQGARRKIRIAIKKGVEVRSVGAEGLDAFARLMQITGERDRFATRPAAYFARFLDALGEHARLYLGFYQGEPVCGALTTHFAGKCCYVYGASDNAHRDVMPNYLMQWEMIRWAVESGCTVYDFQGVSGNLDPENNPMYGLYQFKQGFNGTLDELIGEFDYIYQPIKAKMVDSALALHESLHTKKHRTDPPRG